MAGKSIIWGSSGSKLASCRDNSSWITLYCAFVFRNHNPITENESRKIPSKYLGAVPLRRKTCDRWPNLCTLPHPIPEQHVSHDFQNAGVIHNLQQRLVCPSVRGRNPLWTWNKAGKTIEVTINLDWKMPGGYIGLSATFAKTERWVLNNTRRGVNRKHFLEHLSITLSPTCIHKELAPAYYKEDIKAVGKPVDVLEDVITNHGKNAQCTQACPRAYHWTRQQK